MIIVKKSNGYVALVVLCLISILFMSYYFTMKPHAMLYNKFTDDSEYVSYLTEETCKDNSGSWYSSSCHQLPERATESLAFSRRMWLITPFLLVIGLLFWLFTKYTKSDSQEYY